ncbi:MAG: hypothetical protein AAF318_00195 [Pseudomonadota bacterium]
MNAHAKYVYSSVLIFLMVNYAPGGDQKLQINDFDLSVYGLEAFNFALLAVAAYNAIVGLSLHRIARLNRVEENLRSEIHRAGSLQPHESEKDGGSSDSPSTRSLDKTRGERLIHDRLLVILYVYAPLAATLGLAFGVFMKPEW